MALAETELSVIEATLLPDGSPQAVASLRAKMPGLMITRCDQSDMAAEVPVRTYPDWSLYLIDRTDHCWTITTELSRASGIVVARHKGAK